MADEMKCSVQIIDNVSIHELAEKHYPNLYQEVLTHDEVCGSSWYNLTKTAYEEFKKFRRMMHRKALWRPIRRLRPVHWETV